MFRIPAREVLLVMVAFCTTQSLDAQGARDSVSAQRARIDSIIPAYEAALRAVQVRDSVNRARRLARQLESLDTARAEGFVVIAPEAISSAAFRAFREAFRQRSAIVRGIPAQESVTLLVHNGLGADVYQSMADRPRHRVAAMWGRLHRARARSMERALDDAMVELLPVAVREWLLDQHLSRGREYDNAFRELATTPSRLARECHAGDARRCLDALGLGQPLDSMRGHSDAQLRALAARMSVPPDLISERSGCVEQNDMRSCFELFRQYRGVPYPLDKTPRASFLMFALITGGEGALMRLEQTNVSVAAAIAAAAGETPEQLAAHWLAHLRDQTTLTHAGVARAVVPTTFWIVVVLLIAMRSTRRRFG